MRCRVVSYGFGFRSVEGEGEAEEEENGQWEGQKKGDRVLKKLVELDATRVREEVVNIYQVRLSCHIASPPTTRHNHPSTNANSVPCRSNN